MNMMAIPARRPPTAAGCSVLPCSSRSDGASCTMTWTIAPAPKPKRNAAIERLNAAAPIQAPSTAGAPATSPSTASRPIVMRSCAIGATIASPSVVLCSAKPMTRNAPSASAPAVYAEPMATPSPRLCSPMPTAISIASDPPEARAWRPASHDDTPDSAQVGHEGAEQDTGRCRRTPASPPLPGRTPRASRRSPGRPAARSVSAITIRSQALGMPPHPREPQHAQRDGDHADVHAEERHEAEEGDVDVRRLDRDGDLVRDRPARRGEQHRLVRLALHPRLLQAQRRGAQAADRLLPAAELHERVVDLRLRDRHRVGAVVADVQLDDARAQHGLLDRELLGGRSAPLPESRSVEQRERGDAGDDECEGREPEQPPRHQVTSKKPCQPSSVNSDWWAWNM